MSVLHKSGACASRTLSCLLHGKGGKIRIKKVDRPKFERLRKISSRVSTDAFGDWVQWTFCRGGVGTR